VTNQKHDVLNDAFRQLRNETRVHWNPTPSRDPADRQADRDALNRALRRAGGKDAPEPDTQGPPPWKSLGDLPAGEGGPDAA
jgi:hypothetical protein